MRAALLFALGVTACAAPPPDGAGRPFETEASYREQRAVAVRALQTAVGRPGAAELTACRAVAVGERPCGGPAAFAVYALGTADPSVVESAASRVTALDRRANAQFGLSSTCEVLEPPELVLRDGLCVADG